MQQKLLEILRLGAKLSESERLSGTFVTLKEELPLVVVYDGHGTTTVSISIGKHIGVGIARCQAKDHFNADIGLHIAAARALEDIVRGVEKDWVSRAKTKDEVLAQRASKRKTVVP